MKLLYKTYIYHNSNN